MFTHKYLMTACCAAVLAFGLAACSSSSSDDDQVAKKPPVVLPPTDDPPPTDDEIAAATKEAGTKAVAIGVIMGAAGLGGTGDGVAPTVVQVLGEYNLAIKHGETSITVEGASPDDDVKFTQARDFGDGRTMHTLTKDADADGNVMTEVAIVSTDIEAPTDIPFVMADGKGRWMLEVGEEFLTFVTDHSGLAMLTDSRVDLPAPSGSVTLMGDIATTKDVKENEYRGTFDGAEGKFTCIGTVAAGCDVTVLDGEITSMVNVHFTPDEDVTVEEDDADYLYYGFWLKKTTDEDGVLTYDEVATFADSKVGATRSVAEVDGIAVYNGGSVGVYVKNVYNPDRTIASATSGHFRADAMLTATFGDVVVEQKGTIAPNLLNTLTGTIDNFVLQHEEENSWSVNLQGAIDADDGTVTSADGATGGGAPGSWSATFHGPITAVDGVAPAPSSVVGEFNANFSDGTAAGGFGARTQ